MRHTRFELEFVHHAVGHHHLPQHLDDALAAVLVELAAQHAGEAVEIDRVVLADGGLIQQRLDLIAVQIEALLQQSFELAPLDRIDLPIDCRGLHQQRGRGEPQFVLAQISRRPFLCGDPIGELLELGP